MLHEFLATNRSQILERSRTKLSGKLDELFLPFQQRGVDKTGLGLSISLKGVRACGGEMHVRDLTGVGCVFTIDLPIFRAAL